jgi:hypothetical protein
MTMQTRILLPAALCLTAAGLQAADVRPLTNPVYLDSAEVGTSIHPIFLRHALPNHLNTELGKVPVGGEVTIYALQFEVKLADNLSLIAVKDGYIEMDPDHTLAQEEGFADVAAGLKYVFHRGEGSVASVRATYEIPLGDDEVAQGQGDGVVNPGLTLQTQSGGLQTIATVGGVVALSDEDSTLGYAGLHLSYALSPVLVPVAEVNYFRVLDAGDGGKRFTAHVDGGVPAVARWEGGDLINLGSANAEDEPDQVTAALGLRVLATPRVSFGAAYEIPLTDEENGLMESRITVDAVIRL